MTAANLRRIAVVVRVAVTLGAAWLVFRNVDWANLTALISRADLAVLALCVLPLAAQFAAGTWRWQIIIAMMGGASVPAVVLAISLGRSLLIGQYLPSTVGADIVRAAMLVNRTGTAIAVRSVISDRVVGLVVLMALIVGTLPFFALVVDHGAPFIALAAISLGGLAAFFLLLARVRLLARLPFFGRHAVVVANDLRQIFSRGRASIYVLALSLVAQTSNVLLIWGLAHALATPITALQCLLVVPPALLISAIPISLGGWGLREGALAAGFALVGASSAGGVAASILYGLTSPLIGIIAELATPLARTRKIAPKDPA